MEREKDTKSKQQAAKKTDGKAGTAEKGPKSTESLDRQGKKPPEKAALGKPHWTSMKNVILSRTEKVQPEISWLVS